MKTVKEWLEELPEPYRSQALENGDRGILTLEEDSVYFALFCAFIWESSPQGYKYWDNLHKKLKV